MPRILLRRDSLHPEESLQSFLVRIARLNHFDSPAILGHLCGHRSAYHTLARCPSPFTFLCLGDLTGVHPEALYNATGHRFAGALVPPDVAASVVELSPGMMLPTLPAGIADKRLRSCESAQYCPDCLREAPYHSAAWLPSAVSACLSHRRLLVDRCAECGACVSIRDVVLTRCGRCGASLLNAPVVPILEGEIGERSQACIQAWLNLAPMPDYASLGLPDEPDTVLLRVLEGLRSGMAMNQERAPDTREWLGCRIGGDGGSIYVRLFATLSSYLHYASAFRALVAWPQGFYEILSSWGQSNGSDASKRLYSKFGVLYSRWFERRWLHPDFHFIQSALNEYLAAEYDGTVSLAQCHRYHTGIGCAPHCAHVTFAEAARMLRVTARTVARLVHVGILTTDDAENTLRLVPRAMVLSLQEKWQSSITREEAAQRLGVTEAMVVDMVRAGMLTPVRGPDVDGSQRWALAEESVCRCIHRLEKHVRLLEVAADSLLGLTTAAKVFSPVGVNAAGVLRLVAEGRLVGYRASRSALILRDLLFDPDGVHRCLKSVKEERRWVGRDEIARLASVKVTVVSRWVQTGLLKPCAVFGNAQHFDREVVQQLLGQLVASREAARILGIGVEVVQKWARAGRLQPVSGPNIDGCHRYLFRRCDVEALQPGSRMTAPALAVKMEVDRQRVWQWIQQGRVHPVSGPGIDGCGQYLFLKDQLGALGGKCDRA